MSFFLISLPLSPSSRLVIVLDLREQGSTARVEGLTGKLSSESSDAATCLSGLPRQALGCPGGERDSVKTLSVVPNNVHITFSRGAYRMPFSFDLLFSIPSVFSTP